LARPRDDGKGLENEVVRVGKRKCDPEETRRSVFVGENARGEAASSLRLAIPLDRTVPPLGWGSSGRESELKVARPVIEKRKPADQGLEIGIRIRGKSVEKGGDLRPWGISRGSSHHTRQQEKRRLIKTVGHKKEEETRNLEGGVLYKLIMRKGLHRRNTIFLFRVGKREQGKKNRWEGPRKRQPPSGPELVRGCPSKRNPPGHPS